MSGTKQCDYCGRTIKGEPTIKTLRGNKHTFCTEFCFRLYFFKIPDMTYEKLYKNFYEQHCISILCPPLRELVGKEGQANDS